MNGGPGPESFDPAAGETASPPELVAPPLDAAPPPERYPFWGYAEVFLFAGLSLPSMLLGAMLVRTAFSVFHLHPAVRTIEEIPAQLLGYALLFGALLVLFRVQYDRPFWRSLGWNNLRLPVVWIVLAGLATAYAVAAIGTKLIHVPETSNPMTRMLEDRTSVLWLTVFGVTIAPLCEELAFRGFLQPLLVRSLGAAPGIVAAAIPFGLLHYAEYESWRQTLLVGMAGAAFGWMRQATGSTKAATLMHASYNALFFIALYAQRRHG